MIDASKFAKPVGDPQKFKDGKFRSFSFAGKSNKEVADEVRKFADGIEEGFVLIQKIQSGAVISADEYLTLGLYFEFHEMVEVDGQKQIAAPRHYDRIIDLGS